MIPQEITVTPQEQQKTTPPKSDTTLQLRYFYGNEVENTTFIMTPKLLFRNKELSNLTSDSKLLYIFMLDRQKLSCKNGFREKDGRLYIFYTIEEACYELHKTNKPVCNAFKELEKTGLIERLKRGQGKADKIYVKNIDSEPADYPTFRDFKRAMGELLPYGGQEFSKNNEQNMTYKAQNQGVPPIPTVEPQPEIPLVAPEIPQSYPQYTEFEQNPSASYVDNSSKITEITVDNFSHETNVHFQNGSTSSTRTVESPFLEVANVHGNNTDVTNNENNKTDLLTPTLHPNPQKNLKHPLSDEVLVEGWGVGWRDMDRETKLNVMSCLFEKIKRVGDLNASRKELDRLFYFFRDKKEYMELALDVLLSMDEKEEQSFYYKELSRERFEYDTLVLYRQALLQMLMKDITSTTKYGAIKYYQVIEALVPQISMKNGCFDNVALGDIVDCTIENYIESSNASETPIKHKIPYMQSTIWTTLQEGCIKKQADYGRFAVEVGIW